MPAATLRRIGKGRPVDTADGFILTTGEAARIVGVAPRTMVKWCDTGGLPSWKLPCSPDRRLYAHDLREYLARFGSPIPAELDALVGATRELIIFRCHPATADAVAALVAGLAPVVLVADEWELGQLFGRRYATGVLVCGEEAAASETRRIFSRVPAGWLKVHARGPDQPDAAEGADLSFGDTPPPALAKPIARALAGRKS